MAMDRLIAEYFGNNVKTASVEVDDSEQEKIAQMEIFTKLASDQGIDLDKLSEDQISHLWNHVFSKEASEEEGKGEKEKESEGDAAEAKKEEAKKEHEEKKEAMAKIAEAATLGKIMAHSLVAELREISKEASGEEVDPGETQEGENKEAAMPPQLAAALGKGKALAGKAGKAVSDAAGKAKGHVAGAAHKAHEKGKEFGGKALETAKKHKVPAAAAAGGAAVGFMAGRKKESSAIDELALIEAVKVAEAGGFDVEEAANRVAGVFHLGMLGESEKVASAIDADAAVQVRALEFLEAAGYPVTWES